MGHYQPKKELVLRSYRVVTFNPVHSTARQQSEKLYHLGSFKNFSRHSLVKRGSGFVCDHLLKSLNFERQCQSQLHQAKPTSPQKGNSNIIIV